MSIIRLILYSLSNFEALPVGGTTHSATYQAEDILLQPPTGGRPDMSKFIASDFKLPHHHDLPAEILGNND